jgi:hypothetical protein
VCTATAHKVGSCVCRDSGGVGGHGKAGDRHVRHWLVAILVVLCLTLAADGLDILLLLSRTSYHGLPHLLWGSGVVRILVLVVMAGAAFYYYKAFCRLDRLNASLTDELQQHAGQLADKLIQLNRLKQLSENLINQVDLEPALELALEMAVDVIGARTSSIMLFDPESDELHIVAARGLPEDVVRNTRVRTGRGTLGPRGKRR